MSEGISSYFENALGSKPEAIARAPGRLEILGNHTDYNEGLVLSAAVGQATEFAIRRKPGRICTIYNDNPVFGGSKFEFDLDNIEKPVKGDWTNYVKGVIVQLRKRGYDIGAFDGAVSSTVPLSAGMSSSAALEISACFAFAKVFGIDLDGSEWARLGQAVENKYMGVNTGLLDQFSSVYGKKDSLIYCDFRKVSVLRTVKMPPGCVIVVANSMLKHDLVDSEYNERRESCENAARVLKKTYPEVNALRDVTPEMLESAKKTLDKRDYMRAAHVVGENDRVMRGVAALEKGDISSFGKMLYESHKSSVSNFENSCPELDCLVELSTSIPGCLGARLSGGGFGGISIHLVEAPSAEEYSERLKTAFRLRTGKDTETIICSIGDGASVK